MRNLSSGPVSVRRNLRLPCFSWRPPRRPICRTLGRSGGGGARGHSIQPGQNLGWRWEDWSEGGRLVWMGPQPPGNERLPFQGSMRPLHCSGQAVWDWAGRARVCCVWHPSSSLGFLRIGAPYARTLFRPLSRRSKYCKAVMREPGRKSTPRPAGKVTRLCSFVLGSNLEAMHNSRLDHQS